MKTKRYWLWGGLFAGILWLIMAYVFIQSCFTNDKILFCQVLERIGEPFSMASSNLLSGPVTYIIAGVIIGIGYGKIKNRNKIV